jgi:hypothetical protein
MPRRQYEYDDDEEYEENEEHEESEQSEQSEENEEAEQSEENEEADEEQSEEDEPALAKSQNYLAKVPGRNRKVKVLRDGSTRYKLHYGKAIDGWKPTTTVVVPPGGDTLTVLEAYNRLKYEHAARRRERNLKRQQEIHRSAVKTTHKRARVEEAHRIDADVCEAAAREAITLAVKDGRRQATTETRTPKAEVVAAYTQFKRLQPLPGILPTPPSAHRLMPPPTSTGTPRQRPPPINTSSTSTPRHQPALDRPPFKRYRLQSKGPRPQPPPKRAATPVGTPRHQPAPESLMTSAAGTPDAAGTPQEGILSLPPAAEQLNALRVSAEPEVDTQKVPLPDRAPIKRYRLFSKGSRPQPLPKRAATPVGTPRHQPAPESLMTSAAGTPQEGILSLPSPAEQLQGLRGWRVSAEPEVDTQKAPLSASVFLALPEAAVKAAIFKDTDHPSHADEVVSTMGHDDEWAKKWQEGNCTLTVEGAPAVLSNRS